jgi:hypothetical protein
LRDRVNRDSSSGQFSGSSKDLFKEKTIAAAADQSISKRTVENALAKHRGPVFKRTPPPMTAPPPRTDINNIAIDRIARDAISFLEPKLKYLKQSEITQILTAISEHFQPTEPEEIVL